MSKKQLSIFGIIIVVFIIVLGIFIAKYVNDKQREKLKGSRTVGTTVPLELK